MILGAALSSTKSISLAGFNLVVLVHFNVGLWCRECSIFDLCLRRCRTAWSPHLMIGFACAGKFPSQASCSDTRCVQFPTRDLCGADLASHSESAYWKHIILTLGMRKDHAKDSFVWRIRSKSADSLCFHLRSSAPFRTACSTQIPFLGIAPSALVRKSLGCSDPDS